MSVWAIVAVGVLVWCVVSVIVAFGIARAIRIRDERERDPVGIPDYVPFGPYAGPRS